MNKKLIFLAVLVSLLALSLTFVSCDNGTTSEGGNTFTMTNISATKLSEGSQLCYVGLYPEATTKVQVESDVTALMTNATTSYITAGRQIIDDSLSAPATISGTMLSASSGFSAEWKGDGTYHIWLGLSNGSAITVYRTNTSVTLTAGGSITLNAETDFSKQ
jgi:hypothetical protein